MGEGVGAAGHLWEQGHAEAGADHLNEGGERGGGEGFAGGGGLEFAGGEGVIAEAVAVFEEEEGFGFEVADVDGFALRSAL